MRDTADSLEMFAVGAMVGAGLMFLLDPKVGRARRAFFRDKVVHGIHAGRRQTSRFLRDKRNRVRGAVAETFGRGQGRELLRKASRYTGTNLESQVESRVRA